MYCNFWEKCTNSHKTGQGWSIPLNFCLYLHIEAGILSFWGDVSSLDFILNCIYSTLVNAARHSVVPIKHHKRVKHRFILIGLRCLSQLAKELACSNPYRGLVDMFNRQVLNKFHRTIILTEWLWKWLVRIWY